MWWSVTESTCEAKTGSKIKQNAKNNKVLQNKTGSEANLLPKKCTRNPPKKATRSTLSNHNPFLTQTKSFLCLINSLVRSKDWKAQWLNPPSPCSLLMWTCCLLLMTYVFLHCAGAFAKISWDYNVHFCFLYQHKMVQFDWCSEQIELHFLKIIEEENNGDAKNHLKKDRK